MYALHSTLSRRSYRGPSTSVALITSSGSRLGRNCPPIHPTTTAIPGQPHSWQAGSTRGSFSRDTSPAFYLVEHTFRHRGTGLSRLELMCRVRLEEYERGVVLPHEYTRAEDKRDRLALMEACHVNLSPIMCLYRDRQRRLSQVFRDTLTSGPLVEFSDAGEQGYRLWRIDADGDLAEISEVMSPKSLYIADGHHRYETALAFRDRAATGRVGSDQPSNFVMMGLIDFDDPGLLVLPYDRVLRGLDATTLKKVGERLRQFFDIEPYSTGEAAGLDAFLAEIDLRGKAGPAMGLLDPRGVDGAEGEALQLLTLKNDVRLESWGPVAESEAWILEEQVLRPILGDALAQCLGVHSRRRGGGQAGEDR